MFKVLGADSDTYITNRIVNKVPQVQANVGNAGSLDLFKLYGITTSLSGTVSGAVSVPNVELSRLLVHFSLAPLKQLVALGALDPGSSAFSCRLHLFDVYGGQPTPDHFYVTVFPLSASFDEGHGRDVVYYSDTDTTNWMTASLASGSWFASGCGLSASAQQPCDYITGSSLISAGASLVARQFFPKGTEDLDVDVTMVVSATLAGLLPDVGFRVAFDQPLEQDTHTYFVKRFASRTAFNTELHPELIVRYDDSVQDDTNNLYLDSTSYLFLYNYVRSTLANLVSGSTQVTGSHSLVLQLVTPVSGGTHSLYFTGSQHFHGIFPVTGVYSSSVLVPSTDPLLLPQWQASGSIAFTPIWQSFDGTVAYLTGSVIRAFPPQRGPQLLAPLNLTVSIFGLHDEHSSTEVTTLRVHIFDYTQAFLKNAVRLPVELPGVVIRDVHYQVRDNDDGNLAVPFDLTGNSTRVSNDSAGMFFSLDMSNLTSGHAYVIDIMTVTNNNQQLYRGASAPFRVVPGP
jgi:hypothetical protein